MILSRVSKETSMIQNENNQFIVRILNRNDLEAYNDLSLQAFKNARGFTAATGSISWAPSDEVFYQFGIFYKAKLISFMRLEWITSVKEFKGRLKYEPKQDEVPAGYLNVAATALPWQGKGLNSLLRYYCIHTALSWRVRYLYGSMVPGSPRTSAMQRMGYKFFSATEHWQKGFQSQLMPMIAQLDLLNHGREALKIIADETKDIMSVTKVQINFAELNIRDAEQVSAILLNYKSFFGSYEPTRE